MAIPVENIYYLLCYAYDHATSRDLVDVGAIRGGRIEALFAHVLSRATERLLKRGIDRSYSPVEETLRGVRNKIVLSETVRRGLQLRGELHCSFSELSEDTAANRLLRLTLRRLSCCAGVHAAQRGHLIRLARRIHAADVDDARALFSQLQMHGNIAHYRLPLAICRLLHEHAFANEGETGTRFIDFSEDETVMGDLFEDFIRRFIALEIPQARLGARRLAWESTGTTDDHIRWLPGLVTDVPVVWPEGDTIIECKYYANPTQVHRETERLRSAHLNQLFAYLTNWGTPRGTKPNGLLLYASPGRGLRVDLRLQGYEVQVRTVNLDQGWEAVDTELRRVVEGMRRVPSVSMQATL
ncbi:MAG TPA: hypothetical protein VHO25_03545 [Polyangiaceae bacterium]|nr:hypothetical protein [Polyangiaceae bacterium]